MHDHCDWESFLALGVCFLFACILVFAAWRDHKDAKKERPRV